ncbi:uncharacterized protein LOC123300136 [Chrysoperla carnea]|uniref:uncharacterized protein LOC123300136 n=1 Tax=Chrysoperla carnea TaxID=189513 RepID=UPI001D087119|nr:uncharacterized protein LOC123300136 [Chrysoperla carnea]
MISLHQNYNGTHQIRMSKDHRYRYKFTILKKKLSERGRLGIANSLILLSNYGGQDQAIKRSYSPGEVRCIFGINNISCVPEYSSLNHVAQMVCDPVEWRRMLEDDIAQKIENINRWNNETQQFNHHCYDQSELMSLYGITTWPTT